MSDPAPDRTRGALVAAAVVAVLWAVGLGTLAVATANPPTLNVEQLRRADALVWAEVQSVNGGTARLLVKDVAPAGGGPAAAGPAAGKTVTVRAFPEGAAVAGDLRAVPVRRAGAGWEVPGLGESLPRFVYAGDWSELSAAAARERAGGPAYP